MHAAAAKANKLKMPPVEKKKKKKKKHFFLSDLDRNPERRPKRK
jgi:hypothetical protein